MHAFTGSLEKQFLFEFLSSDILVFIRHNSLVDGSVLITEFESMREAIAARTATFTQIFIAVQKHAIGLKAIEYRWPDGVSRMSLIPIDRTGLRPRRRREI